MDGRGPFGHPGHPQMQHGMSQHHMHQGGYGQYGMHGLMAPAPGMGPAHMQGNGFGLGGGEFPGQYFGGGMPMGGHRGQQHHHHHYHQPPQQQQQYQNYQGRHYGRGRRPPQNDAEPAENLTGSYVRTEGLLPIDERGFKAAGILPWRRAINHGTIEVLLGLNKRQELSIFGGVRDKGEEPIQTALREFCEETNSTVLEGMPGILADIRRCIQREPHVIWMLGGKYALYPLNVSNLSVMHIRQVVELPTNIPLSLEKTAVRSPSAEMDGAQWVDLAAMTLPLPRMPFHRFITSMVSSDPAFKAWARSPASPEDTNPFDVKRCLPCRYWEAGTCTKGSTCDYMHAGQAGRAKPSGKGQKKCKYFLAGHCRNEGSCPYLHRR